jgi:drug/metabolite transporter (DMT)-like permease
MTMSRTAALWMTFVVVLMIVAGQLLFKAIANRAVASPDASLLSQLVNWQFVLAIAIYGVGTITWIWTLRFVPLNLAYPIYALAFVLLPIASYFLYGEPLGWQHAVGSALIVAGVFTITRT